MVYTLKTIYIFRIYNILSPKGINIIEVINSENKNESTNIIIGSIAVQLAVIDILKTLELSIDSFIGFSLGEIVAAYADNCLTLEQAVEVTFAINQGLIELNAANLVSYNVELNNNKVIILFLLRLYCFQIIKSFLDNTGYSK